MDWIVNVTFLIDIIVTLFVVIDVNGKEIDSFFLIFKNYLKGWFIIDVLTIFPYDRLFDSNNISLVAKLP